MPTTPSPAIAARLAVERDVVTKLIEMAQARGFVLIAVDDGEESTAPATLEEALDAVFAVDEAALRFKHPQEDRWRFAYIVLGNDGWDAVADHSTGGLWDAVMADHEAYTDQVAALTA